MDANQILTWLNGRKTYVAATLVGVVSWLLFMTGLAPIKDALINTLYAGVFAALRHALSKLPFEQLHELQAFRDLYQSVLHSVNTGKVRAGRACVHPASDPARPADGVDPSHRPPP